MLVRSDLRPHGRPGPTRSELPQFWVKLGKTNFSVWAPFQNHSASDTNHAMALKNI